jgi:hypothetical protein
MNGARCGAARWVAAWVLITALAPAAGAEREPLNDDWLRDDRVVLRQLLDFERESGIHDGGVWHQSAGDSAVLKERRELGFGAVHHRLYWPGGYASATAEVVELEGEVVEYRLSVRSGSSWEEVRDRVLSAWVEAGGGPFAHQPSGIGRNRSFDAAAHRLEAVLIEHLGDDPQVRVPRRLRHAHAELRSPFSELSVSRRCGDGAPDAYEWRLLRTLLDARRTDLLESVLRGPNPEGRVLALAGLRIQERRGTTLSAETQRAMETVLSLQIPIDHCFGCEVTATDAQDAVERIESEWE